MSHANATLTPRTRLRLARLIVDDGWSCQTAAKMFMVAPRTARKWAERYRLEGAAGMADRSSRPHRSPNKTPSAAVRRIVDLRWRHRLGPIQIAGRLGLPASMVHAVLVRCRINRLSHIDRVTGRRPAETSESVPIACATNCVAAPHVGGFADRGRLVGRSENDPMRVASISGLSPVAPPRH